MSLKITVESVDKTSYLRAQSLHIELRADNRSKCYLTFQTTANTWLPVVGQDIQVLDVDGETETVIFGGLIRSTPQRR